ncbi:MULTISPECIES: hypothetical protein [Kribbella]|nr:MULTISPECIES: hypothetical protein [Kribbella]
MKLFQAELFLSMESRPTNATACEKLLDRIRPANDSWRKDLSLAHQINHELNQIIPVIATDDYLYSTLEYELKRKADPEHKILITEIFDESDVRALLSRHGIGSAGRARDPVPTDLDRRRAVQLLKKLYEQRDEGWVYDRAVLKLKRHYLMFHALVVGIILVLIGRVIDSIRSIAGTAPEQLMLATLAGALGAILAATFKIRDTVARLNDLPAAIALAIAQTLIGAALGFVAWLLLRSGVIQVGGDASLEWETLSLAAFASGFSEPLILGMITRLAAPASSPQGTITPGDRT